MPPYSALKDSHSQEICPISDKAIYLLLSGAGVQAVGSVLKQQGEQKSKFTSALQIIFVHGGENMHNIEFAILAIFKCMVHWHEAHSLLCSHTDHPSPKFSHLPKLKFCSY